MVDGGVLVFVVFGFILSDMSSERKRARGYK